MKTFWLIWTYSANYSSVQQVQAENEDAAVKKLTSYFSDDFQKNASIYVFAAPPKLYKNARVVPINI